MTKPHVIVVGSINVDLVLELARLPETGETLLGARWRQTSGGKGANQAAAAASAGAEVELIGAVGADEAGRREIAELETCGVNCDAVGIVEGASTGLAVVEVNAAGENRIGVAPGANWTLGAQVERSVRRLLRGNTVVLVSQEVPAAAVTAALMAATRATSILNPAPWRAVSNKVLATVDVITPNATEAKAMLRVDGGVSAILAAATARVERGAHPTIVVTLGARGAAICNGGVAVMAPAPSVKAVDTTGAGDVFNGTLAAAMSSGLHIVEAAHQAVDRAAASVQTAGARVGRGSVQL